jgi:hypothetical protein
MPPPLRHLLRKPRYSGGSARHIESGIPQIYSRTSDRNRRIAAVLHERKDLDPSHPLQQVYYRRRRELLLMAAGIGTPRSLSPLDTNLP